jgi:adenosylcobinamide-phosphate synthase
MSALWLPTAVLVDLLLGDPCVGWHPVRLVGRFARWVESWCFSGEQGVLRGLLAWCSVLVASLLCLGGGSWVAGALHPAVQFVWTVLVVYISIAPRDLAVHATRVQRFVEAGNLPAARGALAQIVGRDTATLCESEICRATVETVAESTVDGITAALFYAALFGPIGAGCYRVINTLDSLWGHRDERYARFGMVAARADDVANYVPARLTLGFIAVAAWCCRLDARAAFLGGMTEGSRHPSPNSGLSEAAFAGALDVTLGGANCYQGEWYSLPQYGSGRSLPNPTTIRRSVILMGATTVTAVVLFSLLVHLVGTILQVGHLWER